MTGLFKVELTTIDDVKTFVTICSAVASHSVVRQDSYAVNGASLMGMFSLDLSKPLTVEIDDDRAIHYFRKWMVVDDSPDVIRQTTADKV